MRPTQLDAVTVEYPSSGRLVACFCGERVSRSIVPHFKRCHEELWSEWVATFVALRGSGNSSKDVMRTFQAGDGKLLFSWTVIERAIREAVESGSLSFTPPPKAVVRTWQPVDFELERTTVWDFPKRGDWAVHSGDYRGNWPPQLVRNLIERYTQPGDLVVDGFAGGGTTLIEAWLLNRPSIGIDVSNLAMQFMRAKLGEMEALARDDERVTLDPAHRPLPYQGCAQDLVSILDKLGIAQERPKLVCLHPPYLDAIRYSNDHPQDLSLLHDVDSFLAELQSIATRCLKVLREYGTCALLIGDVRKDGKLIPLGLRGLDCFQEAGFEPKEVILKTQHHDRSSEFYKSRNGGLLMAHEYLFILKPHSF